MKINELPTPCYVIDEKKLRKKEYERLFCNCHIVTVEYAQTELVHDELDGQLRLWASVMRRSKSASVPSLGLTVVWSVTS